VRHRCLRTDCGAGLFWPAATLLSFNLFLGALFLVGLGFAMLQIAANPYVNRPWSRAHRLQPPEPGPGFQFGRDDHGSPHRWLFTSIGWPNIFSLALDGMGTYKSQVSSLLVMAILGGALLPYLQGLMWDKVSHPFSFIVPMIAFAYVAFYGALGHKIGRHNQILK
jgi:fucose permease